MAGTEPDHDEYDPRRNLAKQYEKMTSTPRCTPCNRLPIANPCIGSLEFQVDTSNLDGFHPRVDVVEVVKGVTPLEGTVTLSYRGAYTPDLAFDAPKEEASTLYT